MQNLIPILTFLGTGLTILGGFVGYFVKDFLDKKREINSKNNSIKRDMYKKFVDLIIDLFHNSKNNPKGHSVSPEIISKLYEFYKDYCLYSSPKVINAFGDFMQYLYKNPEEIDTKIVFQKLSSIIKNMRRELGLSNWGLGRSGERIFRAMFNDYDKLM